LSIKVCEGQLFRVHARRSLGGSDGIYSL